MALHPPILNERLHPARVVDALAHRGREARTSNDGDLNRIIAAVVPPVVNQVLDSLDLTALVRERVDIDMLVSAVDIAAIVDRLDIDAIVRQVGIDAIAKRIDLDAIVERIDIDAVVSRIDLAAIVDRVDLDAIVDRVDVVSLAEEVVNGIDLPEIIRQSTGTMASEVVRDARMQSIVADVAIARLVDRIIHRRRARRTDAPGEAESRARVNLPEPTDETQTQQLLPPQPESPKQELRR